MFLVLQRYGYPKVISSCSESRGPASVVFALASGAFCRLNAIEIPRVLGDRLLVADLFDPASAIVNIAKLLLDDYKKLLVCLR